MDDIPDLSSDEDQSGYDTDEWKEMDTDEASVTCLFCEVVFDNIENAIKHAEEVHAFILSALKSSHEMDCYSYIKLINYIRTRKPEPEVVMCGDKKLWSNDEYLKPVVADDWLWYDFDSIQVEKKLDKESAYHANVENGLVTLSEAHFSQLQLEIHSLKAQLGEKDTLLQLAQEDICKMKGAMNTLIEGDKGTKNSSCIENTVSRVSIEDDQGYFNSYAHFGIHYEMLSDKVRTESYQKAIVDNADSLRDKIILDLGCGTGVLSMFAATAGAKKVYALDQSDIVYHAMDIIRENSLQDTIKVLKGRLEDTGVPEKVDVIISEWMGYFLLFEAMLDSVIYARDKFLNPNGLLLPNRCNMSLVGNGDVEMHNALINFWSDVYGYKMNCMKTEVVREASIDVVGMTHILTSPYVIKEIDINSCTTSVMDFSSSFTLPVLSDGYLTSLVGYFDTFFDVPNSVSFSTGPHVTPTHWKQTIFYLKERVAVKKGDVLTGTIICSRSLTDVRALTVQIEIFGKVHKYIVG